MKDLKDKFNSEGSYLRKRLSGAKIKELLLNILKEIDAFCAENNLTYYLAYGTLLGAVRHKGFIPWDDDIDIWMPRPDYERFISSFTSQGSRYQVVSHFKDKKYPYFFAKVHDTATILEMKTTFNYQLGLYVDIYPVDVIPSDKNLQKKHKKNYNLYRNIYGIKAIKYRKGRGNAKNLLLLASRIITFFIPLSFLPKKIDKISGTYNYTDYDLASIAIAPAHRLILDKHLFSTAIKLRFEDMDANVPIGYAEILSKIYGNYLTLPPIEKQVSHHAQIAFML